MWSFERYLHTNIMYFNWIQWKRSSMKCTSVCTCGKTDKRSKYLKLKPGISKSSLFWFSPPTWCRPRRRQCASILSGPTYRLSLTRLQYKFTALFSPLPTSCSRSSSFYTVPYAANAGSQRKCSEIKLYTIQETRMKCIRRRQSRAYNDVRNNAMRRL